MGRIPKKPEEIFDQIASNYREIFGADLLSIILYGSGARGDYIPKKSDINFLIILTEEGIEHLEKALKIVAKWHKRRVSTPLFLTKSYIESSLDTFPIEFLNIKNSYKIVYGEDVLKDLTFEKKFVRLQCERELKGKLLQLRENFLETQGKKREIELLIARSAPTFFSLFHAVLFLKEKHPPIRRDEFLQLMAEETGLNKELFLDVLKIKEGNKRLSSADAISLMQGYIGQIRQLSKFVDQIDIMEGNKA